MNLYFISGLGADERVFKKIELPKQFKIIHIAWPQLSTNETLQSYVSKIALQINISEKFGLVGLSFGGMVTVELAKILKPEIAIIISSIATVGEMPNSYQTAGRLSLNKLLPSFTLNKLYPFTYWYFGVSNHADKKLLKQIITDTSPVFLKWAINEIIHWRNITKPQNLIHIHGTKDRLFPIKKIKADFSVEGGTHFMVYTKAAIISEIIGKILLNY